MPTKYTILDSEERKTLFAALDGNCSIKDACQKTAISYDRLAFTQRNDRTFQDQVRDVQAPYRTNLAKLRQAQVAQNKGKALTEEQQDLMLWWLNQGLTEGEAAKKSQFDIALHRNTVEHLPAYAPQVEAAKHIGKTNSLCQLERKLVQLLLSNWEETEIEYRALLGSHGRPILTSEGNARIYIHKITVRTLPEAQCKALVDVLSRVMPEYSTKANVAHLVASQGEKSPAEIRSTILARLKELAPPVEDVVIEDVKLEQLEILPLREQPGDEAEEGDEAPGDDEIE